MKDGTTVYLEASAARIEYLGEFMTLSFIRDVGDRKKAQEEKERLHARLAHGKKMEAIGTLAGGVAHDFNNLLTVLMGYAALVCRKLDKSDPCRPYMDHILSASQKAASLTQGLLTFSRRRPIALRPVNLNDAIRGTIDLLRNSVTEDITVNVDLGFADQRILGDPVKLDQILLNLVANARDAMPHGGALSIATTVVYLDEQSALLHGLARAGEYAALTVSDTGQGMDEETKAKVYQPFFTTKEVGKGTGLGLSTVYGIVKQHSGSITAQSEPNKGTTFQIFFPVADTSQEISIDEATGSPEGTETILIAEDDEAVRGFIKDTLEYSGYSVIEAADGQQAATRFQEEGGIDLVIMDTVMPKISGKEAFDSILRSSCAAKVIFMSGHADEVLAKKGLRLEGSAFITKPISAPELLAKVREVLQRTNNPPA